MRQTLPRHVRGKERVCVLTTNPYALPVRLQWHADGWLARILPVVREVVIGPRRVAVRKRVFGLTVSLRVLSASQFNGVVISMREHNGPEGSMIARLELVHPQQRFCVPLFQAYDTFDIVSHWQSWARRLGLPILVRNGSGEIVDPANRLGRLLVNTPFGRRRGHTLGARRPRIPLFRRSGGIQDVLLHEDREMIARS